MLLALGAAIAVGSWRRHTDPPVLEPSTEPNSPPAIANGTSLVPGQTPAGTTVEAPSGADEQRTTAVAGNPTGTGALLVKVLWGDDQLPAADVAVSMSRPAGDRLFEQPRLRTDTSGSALFEDLPPGRVTARIQRGGMGGASQRVEVIAGQRSEVTLTMEVGMNCTGRVVDERGTPVSDATIVLSGWGGGTVLPVGRSGADGTFALRALPTHCHLGARKAGYVPSSQRQFTASEGNTVAFTIELRGPGGTLTGRVIDPQGRPVAGAVVQAGDEDQRNHQLADGASALGPQNEQVRTAADGSFTFAGLEVGDVPIAARAPGLAPWQGKVMLQAGRSETLVIHLQAGATLFGTARDEAGAPLARVDIRIGQWSPLLDRSAYTGDDGTFRIEGLGSGPTKVHAVHDDFGQREASLDLIAGAAQRWDPVLSAGLCCRGRVVDQDGKPVGSVMVEGRSESSDPQDAWSAFENTDTEGRFTLPNCRPGTTLRLTFRRLSVFPELVLEGVVPGPDELLVKMPKEAWVYIQGTVLGPDDQPLPNVHASPFLTRGGSASPAETVDGKTGTFRYGPYPPNTYALRLESDGYPPIRVPERTLAPNEVWDLGTLQFQRGGNLTAQLIADPGVATAGLALQVYDEAGRFVERIASENAIGTSGPLAPGVYSLQLSGAGLASQSVPFTIVADRETRLDVPVHAGVTTTIEWTLPPGASKNDPARFVVRDAANVVVWRGTAPAGNTNPAVTLALRPGEYRIEAELGGHRGSTALSVATNGTIKAKLVLQRN